MDVCDGRIKMNIAGIVAYTRRLTQKELKL